MLYQLMPIKLLKTLLDTWGIKALPTFILVEQNHGENELGRLVSPETKRELLGWYQGLTLKTED